MSGESVNGYEIVSIAPGSIPGSALAPGAAASNVGALGGGVIAGTLPNPTVAVGVLVTHAMSPFTAPDGSNTYSVDTSGGVVTFTLPDGTTEIEVTLVDNTDSWNASPVTVGVKVGQTLCGTLNGTQVNAVQGSLRGYRRTTDGKWHGGV